MFILYFECKYDKNTMKSIEYCMNKTKRSFLNKKINKQKLMFINIISNKIKVIIFALKEKENE